ncbi:MAG: DMT family transporter [Pseudogulbenkiania sp.]|nr:DMT family transporter [Pseudogulbenkiania sp.]
MGNCAGSLPRSLLADAVKQVRWAGCALPIPRFTPARWLASPLLWGATVYLVVACSIFAFWAQNHAVRHRSPTHVALLMGSEPVFGALFALVWLGERLTPQAWLWGGGLIVAVALWASLRRR